MKLCQFGYQTVPTHGTSVKKTKTLDVKKHQCENIHYNQPDPETKILLHKQKLTTTTLHKSD